LIQIKHTADITAQTPTWTEVVRYFYDGLNQRVKKELTSPPDTIYLYDGWQCIEEREADGDLLRQYVYGAHYLDELVAKRESGGSLTFYLQDSNYNVVALAEDDGDVIERYCYEPYGTVTFAEEDGDERAAENALNKVLLFQGQRRDPETGLYYFKNRYYSAELGRFLQRDPAEYKDGMDLYLAMLSNPLSGSDELGLGGDQPGVWEILKQLPGALVEEVPKTVVGGTSVWLQRQVQTVRAVQKVQDAAEKMVPKSPPTKLATFAPLSEIPTHVPAKFTYEDVQGLAYPATGGLSGLLDTAVNYGYGNRSLNELSNESVATGIQLGLTSLAMRLAKLAVARLRPAPGKVAGDAQGSEVVQRWMSKDELRATQETGLLRGGRQGTHYVTDAASKDPLRARQRLALDRIPEVRVKMEVPGGKFSSPTKVPTKYKMPGGGTERTATGNVPVRIIEVDEP